MFPAQADLPAITAAEPAKTYTWRAHVCDMAGINSAAGKEWTLVTLNGMEIKADKPPTMKFESGKLAIFGGINRLYGSYALVHDKVTMGEIMSTRMAGPPELMKIESEFAEALKAVNGFHVHGNELELLHDEKITATFRAGK